MEKMKKNILQYQGNVPKCECSRILKFEDFCLNERIEMDIKSTDGAEISVQQDDVINAVGNKIEQICGWDMEVFKQYVAKQFKKEKASKKDVIHWIMKEANKYVKAEVSVKGEEFVKKNKRHELPAKLIELDYAMVIEKLMRRLRGLTDEDKPTPVFIQQMIDIFDDCIDEDDEEEEEE